MIRSKPRPAVMIWNIVSLNIGWWACVLAAVHGPMWAGLAVVAALVAIHLYLVPARQREIATLLATAIFGYALDSLLVLAGAFSFPAHAWIGHPSPVWMVALWVNFATSFNVALHWLAPRPLLAAVLGAVGGPLAYLGGWQLGALLAPAGGAALAGWVALEWAVATPLVFAGAVRIGRWARQPVPTEGAEVPA